MRPASYSTAALAKPTPDRHGRTADVYPFPHRSSGLLAAYRSALAEWDAKPAQYISRDETNKPTKIGVALLLQHSIDAADMTARRARRAAQERAEQERAAAAELYRQQHEHPLYNTHHRAELLKYWQKHGQPPEMPERALAQFTDYVQRHAGDDDAELKQIAETLEHVHPKTLRERLGIYADRYFDAKNPTQRTAKNLRRTLRAAARQYNEQAAHILKLVHKHGQKYVSEHTRSARRYQLDAQTDWLMHTYIVDESKTNPAEWEYTPLIDCIRTQQHRFSELYTLVRGQEKFYTGHDYQPLFITLTSPAEYHPHPANGSEKWDGSTVRDSHRWFNQGWALVRAFLQRTDARLNGFRVTEPHADGSEHWHVLCYAHPNDIETIKQTITTVFGHSEHAVEYKQDFPKNPKKGRATAAGYMMKYLLKTIGADAGQETSAANDPDISDEAGAADAWRSTWGIRSFQFFGHLYGKQTLWRELRRLDTQPTEEAAKQLWRAARGGRADRFIGTLVDDQPKLFTIRELTTEELPPDSNGEIWLDENGNPMTRTKTGRVIGVEINARQYITHTTKYRLAPHTEVDDLREPDPEKVMDCLRYSYSVSTQDGEPEAPADPPGQEPTPSPNEARPPDRQSSWTTWAEFRAEADRQEAEMVARFAAANIPDGPPAWWGLGGAFLAWYNGWGLTEARDPAFIEALASMSDTELCREYNQRLTALI